MPNEKVLIVDDEKLIRWSVRRQLEEWGYIAIEAESGTGGLAQIRAEAPDLILLDVRLPDLSGIEVLREIKQNNLSIPVIMITGDPQLDDIKTAIKLGALDFIKKPLDFDELQITLANAIDRSRLRSERDSLRDEVRKRSGYHEVVGKSPRMIELMSFVRKVAVSETSTVLIQGESGTGKDLVAKAIHYDSARNDKPFVTINCSAIPETLMEAELFGHERGAFTDAKAQKKGLFEVADGGTLFLDEIGELSTYLAGKTAARAGGSDHPPHRRREGYRRGYSRHRRLQSRLGARRARWNLPPGLVLPAQHHPHLYSPPAPSQGRYPAPRRILHRALQFPISQDG